MTWGKEASEVAHSAYSKPLEDTPKLQRMCSRLISKKEADISISVPIPHPQVTSYSMATFSKECPICLQAEKLLMCDFARFAFSFLKFCVWQVVEWRDGTRPASEEP